MNKLLGGGAGDYMVAELSPITDDFNASFEDGICSPIATEHLRNLVDMPGDFNQDGTIAAADYVAWRKSSHRDQAARYARWRATFANTTFTLAAQAAPRRPP